MTDTTMSSPAVVDGTGYFATWLPAPRLPFGPHEVDDAVGTPPGSVSAVDAATGRPLWRFQTQGAVVSLPAALGDAVFVGSCDHRLYALDEVTPTEGQPETGPSSK